MRKLLTRADPRLPVWLLLLFATLSLALGIYQTRELLHLLHNGVRAPAEVVSIDNGIKGERKALLRFRTESGELQEIRDRFRMYLVRHHAGESVVVLYDPHDPGNATVDIGPWMWQEPGLLFAGFVLLAGMAVLVPRLQARQDTA